MADLFDGVWWTGYVWPTLITLALILAIMIPVMLSVAYLTYAERKIIGAMQLRKGPNVVGPFGLLQPWCSRKR
jgi:NADH-quinone oxidoreductase subunit H